MDISIFNELIECYELKYEFAFAISDRFNMYGILQTSSTNYYSLCERVEWSSGKYLVESS